MKLIYLYIEKYKNIENQGFNFSHDLMKNYEGKVFSSRNDLMRLITCGYVKDEDINKRPLSKLIKDISEELEVI